MARRPLNMRERVLAEFLALLLASSTVGQDVLVTGTWNNLATYAISLHTVCGRNKKLRRGEQSITTAIRLKCFRRQTTNQGPNRLYRCPGERPGVRSAR
jgi:hypothetical protein